MVVLQKKREREEDFNNITTTNMANYLMLFSHHIVNPDRFDRDKMMYKSSSTTSRVFECKTCNRQFSSFQALGGHRASHKKPRLSIGDLNNNLQLFQDELPNYKPKTHGCSICGVEFAIGQALGGHMRRHRAINHQVIVKKKLNGGRILCLDLNLTPLENDLEFNLGKANCFV